MSGGERKKRISRGTGWEEAGGEFFQESYPGVEIDIEALPRDPHYFATLLPSKQSRAATTRKPSRVDNKATFKRRTSTRPRNSTNTMGQNTMPNDIHVAMMPDLSENLANEETTWEEMMLIKAMPVSMTQKKEIKAKLLSADTFRLQGYKQFKWRRRKMWEHFKGHWREHHKKIELWRGSIERIERNFGTGTATFFRLIKWLMLLNTGLAVVIECTVQVPVFWGEMVSGNDSASNESYYSNSSGLFDELTPYDVLQGSGWLETTYIFYGAYPDSAPNDNWVPYDPSLAFIASTLACFILSFIAITRASMNGFKEKLIESEGQYYKYCNMLFAGWDFCISNETSASVKHKSLYYEFKECIEIERREDDRKNRTGDEYCRHISTRIFINMIILFILIAAGSTTYFTFYWSFGELKNEEIPDYYRLSLNYATPLSIVTLNLILPSIFTYLVSLENYDSTNAVRLTVIRCILLRLTTLGVLIASIFSVTRCPVELAPCSYPSVCWENYMGQQIYKLLILDVVAQALVTFLFNFPRMLLAKHVRCKLARIIGSQTFETPEHLIDVAYQQILVWFGTFYFPFMPVFAAAAFFIIFQIKKFACLVNSAPSFNSYSSSSTKSMFMSVLLFTFAATLIPWSYSVAELEPSKNCGPFRGRSSAWATLDDAYSALPDWFRSSVQFLASNKIAYPSVVILSLAVYYYRAVVQANRHMVGVLKKQLVLEGHDKQFLLNRLSAFIKQHQDRHKAVRSVDPPPANSA